MEKRIEQKIKELKIGDKVILFYENRHFSTPIEREITKIGREYIYTNGNYDKKFQIHNGYGEYGSRIFPGNLDEYNNWLETQVLARSILRDFCSNVFDLTREELIKISNILSGNE